MDHVTHLLIGEFFSIASPQECPASVCSDPSIPDWQSTTDMVQMVISDYVANSAGFVYFDIGIPCTLPVFNDQIGKLTLVVTSEQIPPWSPIKLNTTSWKCIQI